MGKSPGKWIKTVLFGKKSSKSTISKDVTIERKASFSAKAPPSDLAVNPPPVLDEAPQTTDTTQDNTEFKNGVDNLSSSKISYLHGMQVAADSDELNRQRQAATMAQAAFRGYLARRAFWALKGIIRLQALVRGHLVRRQAVATLQCVQAIVKFQGLVRGRIVRLSDIGRGVFNKLGEPSDKHVDMLGVNMFLISMKQSTNPFIRKLLASSPTVMPLSLRYDLVEPNSAWNWLDRWSLSSFWVPVAQPKKVLDAKPKRKQANMQTGEIEPARLKRGVRKVPAINNDGISLHSSEFEKPKRNPRKVPIHQTESEDQPQSELEKVKRNLRKVSLSASLPSDKPEAAIIDKPQPNQRKLSGGSPTPDGSEQVVDNNTSEKLSDSPPQPLAMNKAHEDSPPQPLAMNKAHEVLCDNDPSGVELHSLQNGGKVEKGPMVNEDQSYTEDRTNSKENQRTRRRSLPVKQDYPKSVSQNTPNLPSYMQATESAKAKLRAQEIQKIGDDEAENGFTRRHSLPASNVKMSTPSPRLQKPLQANGKGGSKSNRSLTSSGDEKFLQAGWRR